MATRKKLLVVLGAGSSISQGMPSVGDIDRELQELASRTAANSQKPDYYRLLLKNRDNYYARAPELIHAQNDPNYEDILGDMYGLMNGILPKPFGDPILQWLIRADVFEGTGIARESGEENRVHFYAVQDQLTILFKQLADRFRRKCCDFETSADRSEKFSHYRAFFQGLSDDFDLGIYNLNYDTVAVTALPDYFTGFLKGGGDFVPIEICGRRRWRFIYHLHGSVHHTLERGSRVQFSSDFGDRIVWRGDLSNSKVFCDSADLRTSTDQRRMIRTTLIAGRWKLDQIQEEPFLSFYSSLPGHAYEADAVLICGYGFGDGHINNAITNMLRTRKPRPPSLY